MNVSLTISNLKRAGFTVAYFETAREAAEHISAELSGKTIGIGGSVTVDQMGLYDLLTKNNTVVYWTLEADRGRVREARENGRSTSAPSTPSPKRAKSSTSTEAATGSPPRFTAR